MADMPPQSAAFADLIKMFATQQAAGQAGAAGAQTDINAMLNVPIPQMPAPDYGNPMAAFLSSFAGNLGTAISGNPNYQQNANNLIGARRGEAQQTAREKLSQLMQHRSELLQSKQNELTNQLAAAKDAGDHELSAVLSGEADKTNREHIAVQKKIAEDSLAQSKIEAGSAATDRARGLKLQEDQLALSKLMQEIELKTRNGRSLTDTKWNSVLDNFDQIKLVDEAVLAAITKNPKKFPNEAAVFKADKTLALKRDQARALTLRALPDETPDEFVNNRFKLGIFSGKEIQAAAKKKWPDHEFPVENGPAGAAGTQAKTRLSLLLDALGGAMQVGTPIPAIGGVLSAPLNLANYLNSPPDSTANPQKVKP